jgi:radical SAM superfamily enzyme YgiQ (UPF0313 family)
MKSILLLYPPEQTWPSMMCKPNGSLAYPNLAGTLLKHNIEVTIYDACVGNEQDDLQKVFFENNVTLPTGLIRTGVSDQRILEVVSKHDIIGITSIFTHQEAMVLHVAKLIKKYFPEKILVSGGVNARYRYQSFFDAGFDYICTSEAEITFLNLILQLQKKSSKEDICNKVNFLMTKLDNKIVYTKNGHVIEDLDELAPPAWHLLPNERYWKIGRPHGGQFKKGTVLKYASMVTSMGCPFSCSYCHISSETEESTAGNIGKFRVKSINRVSQELEMLKKIGVKQVFIEDDSIFGKKRRAIDMLKQIQGNDLQILDVNGVNIIHLLKKEGLNKKMKPDFEVLDSLKNAGFTELVLPFESSSPRIIEKYASNKWDIQRADITTLIKACKEYGFRVAGNFMLGYPDETKNEVIDTIQYAKERMEEGLDAANFFLVMPLPGTKLFDYAIANNHLDQNFNPDKMHWQKANMKNTLIEPAELENLRDEAWSTMNRKDFVEYKKNMVVDMNLGEIYQK